MLPGVVCPTRECEIASLVVPGLEYAGLSQHQLVWSSVVCGPEHFPGRQIQCLQPAVDAEFTARGSYEDSAFHDQWGHWGSFPIADIGHFRLPQLSTRLRVYCDCIAVEQVVDNLSVCVGGTATNGVAAGHADCSRVRIGTVLPLKRIAFARQIERIEHVGIRSDHVHCAVHYQWLAFVPAKDSCRESPYRFQPPSVAR